MKLETDALDTNAARLQQRITQLLREQPLQRAPRMLALQVLAAIERRQRSAFQRWPLTVRIPFVLIAGLIAHLTGELLTLFVRAVNVSGTAPRPPLAMLTETALAMSR